MTIKREIRSSASLILIYNPGIFILVLLIAAQGIA
jgi:hypothetical protein